MDMFRIILVITGVSILVLLYLSGRPKRGHDQRDALDATRGSRKRGLASAPDSYPQAENFDDLAGGGDVYTDPQTGYPQVNQADPLLADPNNAHTQFDDLAELDPDDFVRPGTGELRQEPSGLETQTTRSSIAQKIENFSSRLSPKRNQRVADAGSQNDRVNADSSNAAGQSKIVTVHVVAPQEQVFNGATLYELFEQRGFHYGEMNIFHSMHQQKKMFSIAKMVEPGYFDIDDINTFYTPGITLILQLPGPVAADVAFEVLISEARGLAQHLGGVVLGSDRSTLSNQAVSHMRDDIVDYMHRQRYFANATT